MAQQVPNPIINAITEYNKIRNEIFLSSLAKIRLSNPKKKASTLKPTTIILEEVKKSLIVYEFNAITQVPNPIIKSTTIVIMPPITYFNPDLPLDIISCIIPRIIAINDSIINPIAICKSASIIYMFNSFLMPSILLSL